LYGKDPRQPLTIDTAGNNNLPAEYTQHALPQLYRQRQLGIFVKKGSSRDVVMHELFHALQFKNGLPSTTTPQADDIAKAFRDRYNQPIASIGFLNQLWQPLKRFATWAFLIPYWSIRRMLQRSTGSLPADLSQSPGEALRVNMKREMEVDFFLLRYGQSLGLPCWQRLNALTHYLLESQLQWYRSYSLDTRWMQRKYA
jgi:hypothetical protein